MLSGLRSQLGDKHPDSLTGDSLILQQVQPCGAGCQLAIQVQIIWPSFSLRRMSTPRTSLQSLEMWHSETVETRAGRGECSFIRPPSSFRKFWLGGDRSRRLKRKPREALLANSDEAHFLPLLARLGDKHPDTVQAARHMAAAQQADPICTRWFLPLPFGESHTSHFLAGAETPYGGPVGADWKLVRQSPGNKG